MNLLELIPLTFLTLLGGLLILQCIKLTKERDTIYNQLSYIKSITQEAYRYLASYPMASAVAEYVLAHAGSGDRVLAITEFRKEIHRLSEELAGKPVPEYDSPEPRLTAGMINEALNLYAEGMDIDLFMAMVLNAYLSGKTVEVEHISGKPDSEAIANMTGHVLLAKLSINGHTIWSRDDGTA